MAENKQHNKIISIYAGLILATIISYEPLRHNDFVTYDDERFVTENSNVKSGLTKQSIIWAFTKSTEIEYWIPLTWLSHMLDYELYGLQPLGHHITNIVFHIANTLLLFVLLKKMTGAIWKSAFVAAAFALHPIHVESVAWIAERKDVLSTLFWMLTLLGYIHYSKKPSIGRYLLVILAFMMGLMSKPMVVTLPLVLILIDYWPLNRIQSLESRNINNKLKNEECKPRFTIFNSIYEKIPLFALSAASCVITLIEQKSIDSLASLTDWPWYIRIISTLSNYFSYAAKIVYPVKLAVFYPFEKEPAILYALATIFCTAFLFYLLGKSKKWFTVGFLWYFGTLAPVIGLVQVGEQSMADRYSYIPSIGVFIIIAWGVDEIILKRTYLKSLGVALAVAAIATMIFLTRIQVSYWKDTPTLFKRTLAVTKNNYFILTAYGRYLCTKENYEEGIRYCQEALKITPSYLTAKCTICLGLLGLKKYDEAIICCNDTLRKAIGWTDSYKLYYALGASYLSKGNFISAEINFKKALELRPDFVLVNQYLGYALGMQNKNAEAANYLKKSIKYDPGNLDNRQRLANVLMATGNTNEAILCLNESLQINPKQPEVYTMLGLIYEQIGDYRSSIINLTKSIELNPDNINTLNSLAWLLATNNESNLDDTNRAIKMAERACELTDYKNAMILDTLAAAYAAAGKYEDAVLTSQKAIDIATVAKQKDLIGIIQNHLDLFKKGQPYRQTRETDHKTKILNSKF